LALVNAATAASESGVETNDFQLCNNSTKNLDEGIPACTRLLGSGRSGANLAAVYLQRGNAWYVKGDYDGAIADYNEAINRNPQFTDAYLNRGRAWFKRGDFSHATKDFSQAVRLDPKSTRAYNDRGLSLYNEGELDLAIKDFGKAISLDSKFAAAYNNRGLAWRDKRNLDAARADYDQVIKLTPNDAGARINRAAVWIDKGDIDRAIADYDEAIRLDPKNFRAFSTRGEAFRLKGNLERAFADHEDAIRLSPQSADAYNNRARAWKDKKDLDQALSDYDEAILIDPQYAPAYAGRGDIWRLKGDLQRSLGDLNKAIGLMPKMPGFLYLRGQTLGQLGELDRAIMDFTEAVQLLPDAVAAYTARGLALERKSETAKAKADFQKAANLPSAADAEIAKPAQEIARRRLAALDAADHLAAEAEAQRFAEEKAKRLAVQASDAKPSVPPDRRIALVIGNSAYTAVPLLPNPVRDAAAIADTLRGIGFQSVTLETNLGRERLIATLRAFGREAETADWAVVYYAGHGIEIGGTNYLIPIDAKLESDRDVNFDAVSLDLVMSTVERARKLHLVLLDACRNSPFTQTMRRADAQRSVGRGLARIEPDPGTLVIYAARHGETALDGDGDHSPFASALMKELPKPGVELRKLFDIVRDDVMETTQRRQQPFTYGSLPGREDFIFAVR
jgi:uncharacterized caspase-like protein